MLCCDRPHLHFGDLGLVEPKGRQVVTTYFYKCHAIDTLGMGSKQNSSNSVITPFTVNTLLYPYHGIECAVCSLIQTGSSSPCTTLSTNLLRLVPDTMKSVTPCHVIKSFLPLEPRRGGTSHTPCNDWSLLRILTQSPSFH